jgi:hypothetical protein
MGTLKVLAGDEIAHRLAHPRRARELFEHDLLCRNGRRYSFTAW